MLCFERGKRENTNELSIQSKRKRKRNHQNKRLDTKNYKRRRKDKYFNQCILQSIELDLPSNLLKQRNYPK